MIGGIGVDIVDVARLRLALQRTARFAEMVFTERERRTVGDGPGRTRRLAGTFAAKEAFLKAVGLGLWQGVPLHEIEIVGNRLCLGPSAEKALRDLRCTTAALSVSHERETAIAMVVVN